jgi:hypothetical protein
VPCGSDALAKELPNAAIRGQPRENRDSDGTTSFAHIRDAKDQTAGDTIVETEAACRIDCAKDKPPNDVC